MDSCLAYREGEGLRYRYIAGGHAAKGFGLETGLVPAAEQTEGGWKHGFCVLSGGRDRYRVHNRPDLEEGLGCGHTARARGG